MERIERYHALAPLYYRSADAAIVVFDAASSKSLKRALDWVEELRKSDPHTVIALVANKADLEIKVSLLSVPSDSLSD